MVLNVGGNQSVFYFLFFRKCAKCTFALPEVQRRTSRSGHFYFSHLYVPLYTLKLMLSTLLYFTSLLSYFDLLTINLQYTSDIF